MASETLEEVAMETLLGIGLGLGLAAACGFRVFVPLLVTSVAAQAGHLELAAGFDWLATEAALVTLGVATALEIGAYFVPWLDNLLDTAAMPAAVLAGIVVTASAVGDVSPLLRWSLAVIAGGGVAGGVQTATTVARTLSSVTTLGFANPVLATAEAGGALGLAALAVFFPLVAAAVLASAVVLVVVLAARRRQRPAELAT
jgi:hypothetical protein